VHYALPCGSARLILLYCSETISWPALLEISGQLSATPQQLYSSP
jgi:hypothetical protein